MKSTLAMLVSVLLMSLVGAAYAQDAVKDAAKDTEHATTKAAKKTAHATDKAADKTADTTKSAGKDTAHVTTEERRNARLLEDGMQQVRGRRFAARAGHANALDAGNLRKPRRAHFYERSLGPRGVQLSAGQRQ